MCGYSSYIIAMWYSGYSFHIVGTSVHTNSGIVRINKPGSESKSQVYGHIHTFLHENAKATEGLGESNSIRGH